jgi:outer membrane protein assembly factor BamB
MKLLSRCSSVLACVVACAGPAPPVHERVVERVEPSRIDIGSRPRALAPASWEATFPELRADVVVAGAALGPDGHLIVAGESRGETIESWLLAVAPATGELRWRRDLGEERSVNVVLADASSIAVGGFWRGTGRGDFVDRRRGDGETVWSQGVGTSQFVAAMAPGGELFVVTTSRLIGYAEDGAHRVDLPARLPPSAALAVDDEGGIFVLHRSMEDCGVTKLRDTGQVVWSGKMKTDRRERCVAMALDGNGGVFVAGHELLRGDNSEDEDVGTDLLVGQLDAKGRPQWQWTRDAMPDPEGERPSWDNVVVSLTTDAAGHMVVAANLRPTGAWMATIGVRGEFTWTRSLGEDIVVRQAIADRDQSLLVVGEQTRGDDTLLWIARIDR